MERNSLFKRVGAEAFGTFWLVFGGCGAAVLAAKFPGTGIGFLGVAFAFGLTLLTMAYAIGPISGCHINPAVSIGLWLARRFPTREVMPYIAAQLVGATVGAFAVYLIAKGMPGWSIDSGLAANGFGAHSPGGYSLAACFVAEVVLTAGFILVILGATHPRVPVGFAPIAIGLALTLCHLVAIPVTNTSVNPARSFGPALLMGGWALHQLWLFWIAPILGSAIGAIAYVLVASPTEDLRRLGAERPAEMTR
jgi:aquaporin Z